MAMLYNNVSDLEILVNEMFDSAPEECLYHRITLEEAISDVNHMVNEGWIDPDNIDAYDYMTAWNDLVTKYTGVS